MEYRSLGRSALQVSAVCLGTMNFGARASDAESFAMLDAAIAAGVNFIDTADQYGGALGVGATEALLGRWLAARPNLRHRLVIATKAHEPMSADVNDRGLSARHIQMACEASLRRLGVDHIDLYQMHHFDRRAPVEETWQALDRLVAQGKVIYVGSSNFPGWAIARDSERALAAGRLGLVSEQSLYNLIERRAELEVIPACGAYGLGLIPWSPLAGGLLAGRSDSSGGRRDTPEAQRAARDRAGQLRRFQSLCDDLGHAPNAIALAWLLHQPSVSATIIGPREQGQLAAALAAPGIRLSPEALVRLDEIFPPCGPAPEAYAW